MKTSASRKVFVTANTAVLIILAIICVLPFLNLLAVSLSSNLAAISGKVGFIPVDFTFDAYKYLLKKVEFFRAFGISLLRVILGTVISLAVMVLAAYPLSRKASDFKGRNVYVVLCIITMFFSGGLVPTFILISKLGMINSIFALVLPMAMNCWNLVLLVNFFRQVPKDLTEYASVEGAGHVKTLISIVIPISMPAIATVVLFTAVNHWNSWFDGMIYMNAKNFPLQTYIYDMIESIKALSQKKLSPEDLVLLQSVNEKTLRSAQIFLAMIPIMLVYPFAQKYFVKGLVMGSVKE